MEERFFKELWNLLHYSELMFYSNLLMKIRAILAIMNVAKDGVHNDIKLEVNIKSLKVAEELSYAVTGEETIKEYR